MSRYFRIILGAIGLAFAIYEFKKNSKKPINGLGKLNFKKPPKVRIIYSRKDNPEDRKKVTGSNDVYKCLQSIWSSQIETREEMFVLLLNRNNQILGYNQLSMGGITGTVADIRLLFATAIQSLATSIIIAHNHPSGNLKPSQADLQLTQKVKEAGKILYISLLDHLIVSKMSYYSFADEGDL